MNISITPETQEQVLAYYQFRWQMLRQPWHQPEGSEKDQLEHQAIHRMIMHQDEVAAVGRLHKETQYHAHIRFMAVDEALQGKGLGQAIIESLEGVAREQGVNLITLNARENAVGFYEKLGYSNQGFSHRLYDDINHYKMTKQLKPSSSHQYIEAKALQDVWHKTIPMSKAMNIEISYFDQQRLITHCDSVFNQNIHHTMFAGSIYTLATLTGWGWIYLLLQNELLQGDIVLADAKIRYVQPIKGLAHGKTSNTQMNGELSELTKGKKVRVSMSVNVMNGDKIAAIFSGEYVILPKKSSKQLPIIKD